MLKRRHPMAGLAGTILAAPLVVRAQGAYPSRSVKIVVPWPPGGGVDAFARVIQAPLSAQLGQTVIVENIGGRAGRVGTLSASRAQPDGYTTLLVNDTFAATEALPVAGTSALYPAFRPVTLAISGSQGLFTHPRSGLITGQAFAAAAKANPGKLNVGVPPISVSIPSVPMARPSGICSTVRSIRSPASPGTGTSRPETDARRKAGGG